MDELIKRLREDGKVELAIHLKVIWNNFREFIDKKEKEGIRFNQIELMEALNVLSILQIIEDEEAEKLQVFLHDYRREHEKEEKEEEK